MKPKPQIRPDRAAQLAKAGEARAVEGYRLVTPRYSSCGRTVLRRSDQRYVSHVVADCATEHAARELARKLNRLDRYERDLEEDRDAARLELVERELRKARRKHPKFVDFLFGQMKFDLEHEYIAYRPSTKEDLEKVSLNLSFERKDLKRKQRYHNVTLFDVLCCELNEAEEAYLQGDLEHAKQELAQCAAVCLRAMEYVQNEMEKTNK